MVLLMDEAFCAALRAARTVPEFLACIDRQEQAKYPEEPSGVAGPHCPELFHSGGDRLSHRHRPHLYGR